MPFRQALPDSVKIWVETTLDLTNLIDDLRVANGLDVWVQAPGPQHGVWRLDQQNALPLSPLVVATMSGIGRWIYFGAGFVPPVPGASPWQRILTVVDLTVGTDTEVSPTTDDQTLLGTSTKRWAGVASTSSGFLSYQSAADLNPAGQLGSIPAFGGYVAMGLGGANLPDTRIRRVAPDANAIPQIAIDDDAGGAVNVIPAVDQISKLGTRSVVDGGSDPVSMRWSEVNAVQVNTGDLNLIDQEKDAHWTIIEERDRILVINRKTGRKYAMALTPIDEE